MSKPTIALVPGAWHTPAHYEPLLQLFRQAGYATAAKQLPSVGSADPRNQTTAMDADFVRDNVLMPELHQGNDVLLLVHSYGGSPGSAAAHGLSKAERTAAGQKGGVVGLVLMCAFVASEGDSLASKLPDGKLHEWNIHDEQTGQLSVDKPELYFYNNIDSAVTDKAVKGLELQSRNSVMTPSGPPAWADAVFDGRRAYIKCGQDNAIPLFVQNIMTDMSGVSWEELLLEDASHSPFLTHQEAILKFVDGKASEWTT